ncbi:MAG: hypothetical protein HYX72_08030 [Acidobacteria bacterium]|nr:hypothetical protein [Acidobacteriota bacterium]
MCDAESRDSEVFQRFVKIVSESLHVDKEQVTADAYLTDLGAESLDLVEIAIHSEEIFNISLPEKNILQTAIEVCGPGVLEQGGVLTGMAKSLLLARMPELDQTLLEREVTVKEVAHSFQRVGTWVRMIEGLMEFTPKICSQCGAVLRTSVALRMKCKQCGAETPIPSGEELNKRWVEEYCERAQIPRAGLQLTLGAVESATNTQSA